MDGHHVHRTDSARGGSSVEVLERLGDGGWSAGAEAGVGEREIGARVLICDFGADAGECRAQFEIRR
jgi:hypothetical protein